MNIVSRIDQYNKNNIFFCEPIKNNVMNDGNFIRIFYSSPYFTLNGIYLLVSLQDVMCEKYYLKYRCSFNYNINKETIDNIKIIEEEILKKYEIKDKDVQFKIYKMKISKFFLMLVIKVFHILFLRYLEFGRHNIIMV